MRTLTRATKLKARGAERLIPLIRERFPMRSGCGLPLSHPALYTSGQRHRMADNIEPKWRKNMLIESVAIFPSAEQTTEGFVTAGISFVDIDHPHCGSARLLPNKKPWVKEMDGFHAKS